MIDTNTTFQAQEKPDVKFEINCLLSEKILQTTPGIIFVMDINSQKIIYSNYTSNEFLGYPIAEFSENGFEIGTRILNADDRELVKKSLTKLKDSADGILMPFEIQLKNKNGNYSWFEIRLTIFTRDESNNALQIIGLLQSIDEKRKTKEALTEGELSYKNLFNTIEDAIYIQDQFGHFIDVNNSAANISGYSKEELIGQTAELLSVPGKNDIELVKQKLADAFNGVPQEFEFWSKKKDGTILLKNVKVYNGLYFGKKIIIAHSQDITKRKKEEEKIQAALAEKNVLLREVHHRVKNNLQAMIYLIEMQIDRITDEKVQIFLKELQEQARTMSLVYEQLYQSDYLAKVDMDGYLNILTSNVIQAFGLGKEISFTVNANNVSLDVETAMPCGLIINELLTNSLKYAFPDRFEKIPAIDVSLTNENKKITISISDNGVGLPPNFDWENTDSLGLKLVNFWIKYQLAGSIKLEQQSGTNYIISFDYED
ncbi:MAG TPA: PAS domain S-box protein [Ignavibacteriaceae bacterium]|nr:PAS domain S-box protein [Ignavibacteriaceae bacterium]